MNTLIAKPDRWSNAQISLSVAHVWGQSIRVSDMYCVVDLYCAGISGLKSPLQSSVITSMIIVLISLWFSSEPVWAYENAQNEQAPLFFFKKFITFKHTKILFGCNGVVSLTRLGQLVVLSMVSPAGCRNPLVQPLLEVPVSLFTYLVQGNLTILSIF